LDTSDLFQIGTKVKRKSLKTGKFLKLNKDKVMKNKKPVLVVIQGGGCRQIECATGILKAFDEVGIVVDKYQGASAGAIVSCLHASGLSGLKIAELIGKTPVSDLFRFSYLQAVKLFIPLVKVDYVYNTDGLESFLSININDYDAEEKVLVTVTRQRDYRSFRIRGDALSAKASSAIPEVFPPVEISKVFYVDGGVIDNIPMPEILNMDKYEHIYILLCNHDTKTNKKSWTKIGRSLQAINEITEREAHDVYELGLDKLPNVTVIQPSKWRSHLLEWSDNNSLINHAYKFTKELLNFNKEI